MAVRKIEWTVGVGLIGCRRSGIIEVEADTSDDEINEMVEQEMWNIIDMHWRDV